MSWIRSELAKERFGAQLPCSTHVEFSEFREGIGLQWYLGYCDTNLTPEDLGAIIDHCTVEFTLLLFSCLEAGKATTEYFKWATSKVYDGMHEDQDLKAYAVKLMKNEDIPLASETYLQLVRYHALYGGNPAPCIEEGSAFAHGMLLEVMKEGYEEFDIEQQTYIELRAYNLILYPSPSQLLKVMEEASESPAAWDVLRLLVADAVERREVHKLPRSLLEWSAGASFGRPKRPEPKPAEKGRPSKLGYQLRNNEIRFTIEMLNAVGMEWQDGCKAVVAAFPYSLSLRKIWRTYQEPYLTNREIRLHLKKRYGAAIDSPSPLPGFNSSNS